MTTATGTSEPGRSGAYRALPILEDEVMNLILRYAVGPMDILLGDELDTLDALKRIDQELEGLGEANPNLACGPAACGAPSRPFTLPWTRRSTANR